MTLTATPAADGSRLQLAISGSMTIYEAVELKQALLAALQAPGALELELAQVDELDTAGVQLLLLLQREALRAGRGFRIASLGPTASAILTALGLTTALATGPGSP